MITRCEYHRSPALLKMALKVDLRRPIYLPLRLFLGLTQLVSLAVWLLLFFGKTLWVKVFEAATTFVGEWEKTGTVPGRNRLIKVSLR